MVFIGTIVLKIEIKSPSLQHNSEIKTDRNRIMDKETMVIQRATLTESDLTRWQDEGMLLEDGCLIYCVSGDAVLTVNFDTWTFTRRSVLILFPGDMVEVHSATDDFKVQMLRYSASLLREASLQLEQTVYSLLRKDRCRGASPLVEDIVSQIFDLLKNYQDACPDSFNQIVLLQLKAFFLGFHNYLLRNPHEAQPEEGSERINELFSRFMEMIMAHYKESREVAFYAARLHISPKYLFNISLAKTGRSPKTIIDHYVIMQLKLLLRTSTESIKQIAWDYHFNDDSFFCRYFKSHTGLSPQQFRKGVV